MLNLIQRFMAWIKNTELAPVVNPTLIEIEVNEEQAPIPYDENLLERSRTQWQFGDWDSLCKLERDALQHHPDRAKLALLAAAGRLQIGMETEARQFVRLAEGWGVNRRLAIQFLISGVYNNLSLIANMLGKKEESMKHLENSIKIIHIDESSELLVKARYAFRRIENNGKKNNLLNYSLYGIKFDKVKIMGMFRSGTNYLKTLIEWNSELRVVSSEVGGWKHNILNDSLCAEILKNNIPILFVVKNPYAEMVSLNEYLNRVGRNIDAQFDWDSFLESDFVFYREEGKGKTSEQWFSNPVDYWNAANWGYYKFAKNHHKIALVVRYEDLLACPEKVVHEICCWLGVEMSNVGDEFLFPYKKVKRMDDSKLHGVADYLEGDDFDGEYYREKKYLQRYNKEQLQGLREGLNCELMGFLGYEIL